MCRRGCADGKKKTVWKRFYSGVFSRIYEYIFSFSSVYLENARVRRNWCQGPGPRFVIIIIFFSPLQTHGTWKKKIHKYFVKQIQPRRMCWPVTEAKSELFIIFFPSRVGHFQIRVYLFFSVVFVYTVSPAVVAEYRFWIYTEIFVFFFHPLNSSVTPVSFFFCTRSVYNSSISKLYYICILQYYIQFFFLMYLQC